MHLQMTEQQQRYVDLFHALLITDWVEKIPSYRGRYRVFAFSRFAKTFVCLSCLWYRNNGGLVEPEWQLR